MSSIVSRRPPVFGSVSQANERRWMSIRFGTSTVLLRRAKLRRDRRASTAAKKRLLRRATDGQRRAHGARPAKIAQVIGALKWAAGAHGPRPRLSRMWRDVGLPDGYGYRPAPTVYRKMGICERNLKGRPREGRGRSSGPELAAARPASCRRRAAAAPGGAISVRPRRRPPRVPV